jgi:hypothetical protein
VNKVKRIVSLLIVAILLTGTASAYVIDSADNRFDVAGDVLADKSINGDYIAFGQNIRLESGVSGDIIAGGRTVAVTDDGAVQNIFAAGQVVTLRAKSARNIYAAGWDVTVSAGTTAKGAYLTGGNISFSGTADAASLTGAFVTADGTVYRDLYIRSDHITFGRNLTVGGQLIIVGSVKPQLPPNIDPAKVTFKRIVHKGGENAQGPVGVSRFKVIMAVAGVVTAILLAILMTLFRGGFFAARAAEFRKRAWKDILFGLIALIVVPVGALACMLTVFAIPVGVIALALYVAVLYLSPAVTGVILGRLFLPKMNRYLSAGLGAAVIRLLLLVPVLKIILFLACALYTLGVTVVRLKPRREKPPGEMIRHE